MIKPTLISLFSGAGGLDLGLEMAGFETRVAVEIDRAAARTLQVNRRIGRGQTRWLEHWLENAAGKLSHKGFNAEPEEVIVQRIKSGLGHGHLRSCVVLNADITKTRTEELLRFGRLRPGEVDLVAGGAPCQPFSRSGKMASVDDSKGQLFADFVRVVNEARPRWFLFENVKGLLQTKTTIWKRSCGRCFRAEIPAFDPERREPEDGSDAGACACGGKTKWHVEKKARGGAFELILSELKRIGYKCVHRLLYAADYGVPQMRERLIIIGSRDGETFSFPAPTHGDAEERTLFTAAKLPPYITIRQAICDRPGSVHKLGKGSTKAVLWVKNLVRPHDEPVTWSLDQPAPTVGAHQGAKLAIAPDGVPQEQLARQQWHTLGNRQGHSKPVDVKHQMLTELDLLRLQTFPDFWFVNGTRLERAFQIGNAVPCALAKAVGAELLRGKRDEENRTHTRARPVTV